LIDIRENRAGQLSAFAKYPDLEFFLARLCGIAYFYEPRLAPSLEIRETYRTRKDWPAYESAFLQLMKERGVPQCLDLAMFAGTVALLCSEPGPEQCHRRLVAELLRQRGVELKCNMKILHLTINKKKQSSRTKRRTFE
jgi:uncharacterized protein (DUF488 family)